MEKLSNIHPGEILLEEFLTPMQISAYRLAKATFIPQTRISEIIKGKRRITADTALRFAKFFGTSAKFWLGLQDDYDLEEEKNQKEKEQNDIKELELNGTIVENYIKLDMSGIFIVVMATDSDDVHAKLSILPYYPFMKIEIIPVRVVNSINQ